MDDDMWHIPDFLRRTYVPTPVASITTNADDPTNWPPLSPVPKPAAMGIGNGTPSASGIRGSEANGALPKAARRRPRTY
jgi:hypothetical protein